MPMHPEMRVIQPEVTKDWYIPLIINSMMQDNDTLLSLKITFAKGESTIKMISGTEFYKMISVCLD